MTSDEKFIQAIVEKPDDDALRMAYADWLVDQGRAERAEFLRAQCMLAHVPEADRKALYDREQSLLDQHWREWLHPLPSLLDPPRSFLHRLAGHISRRLDRPVWLCSRSSWLEHSHRYDRETFMIQFRRGFVDDLSLPASAVLAHTEAVFRAAPLLRALSVHSVGKCEFEPLMRIPQFASLTYLHLSLDPGTTIDPLIRCPHLHVLRELGLSLLFIDAGCVQALVASPLMNQLTRLALGWFAGAEPVRTLVSAPTCRQITGLRLSWLDGEEPVHIVANAPNCCHLTRLDLWCGQIGDTGIEAIARSPYLSNLEDLKFGFGRFGDAGAAAIAASPNLPQLRSLHLGSRTLSEAGKKLLRDRFGDGVFLY